MAKTLSRKVTIYINGKEIENTLQSLNAEMKKLQREQKRMTIGSEEYVQTSLKIKEIQSVLHSQKEAVEGVGESWRKTLQNVANYANTITGIQAAFEGLDGIVGKLKDLAMDAAKLDDAYGQVMKTTGLTHAEVEKLNEAFRKMDTRTSREQLNELAYEAGKLGITGVESVRQFVSASDKINIALGDVLGDGAMVTIGKMADVYSQSTEQLREASGDLEKQMLSIGSAVNELGKISTANEHYLVEFAARMGGVATQAGLSADQVLGFGSALDQSMQKVEMSSTAFQKFIGQIMKKPEQFAKQAGMAVSDFATLIRTDLNEALFRVLEGFSGAGGYAELVNVFKDLGLDGARAATVISAMANNIDKIRVAQAAANEQLHTAASIEGEVETMNNTMQAQAEKARKAFEDMRVELGNELYPVLVHLTKSGTVAMKGLSGLIKVIKEQPAILTPLVALLGTWVALHAKSAAVSVLNATVKATEAMQTRFLLIAEQRRLYHKEKELAAYHVQRKAEYEAIIAKEKLILVDKQYAYDLQGLQRRELAEARIREASANATRSATLAEEAHTRSIKAKNLAFKSTPWGLIISGLTSIGVAVYSIWKNSEKVKLQKTLKEVSAEVGGATYKIEVLFGKLNEATAGSEQYRKALDELKREYPDIISKHIDEAGKLRDIEQAYKDVAEAARNSIYERIRTEKLEEAAGDTAKKVAEQTELIRETIYRQAKKAGKESVADIIFGDIQEELKKLETGEASAATVYRKIAAIQDRYKITPTDGEGHRLYDYIEREVNKIGDAFAKFERTQKMYEEKLGKTDPYGVQKMSLEQLQEAVRKTTAEMELLEKQKEKAENKHDSERAAKYGKALEEAAKKVETYRKAIAKLQPTKGGDGTNGNTTTPTLTPTMDDKELKKWESVKARAERLIENFGLKAESGLQKLKDEIASKRDAMLADIREAVGASDAEKEALIAQVNEAATALEQAKVEEYIKKQTEALEKMRRNLKGEKSDNEYLDKIEEAAKNLASTIGTIDEAIAKAQADSENATDEQREQLESLIMRYRQLKAEMQATVYSRIDTSVSAKPMSNSGGEVSARTSAKVKEKQQSGLGLLFDKGAFEDYGRALESINEKYEKQKGQMDKAAGAEQTIIDKLRQQRAEEAGGEDADEAKLSLLDAEIAKHEEKAEKIQGEQEKLEQLREQAEKAAEEDAFGKAIDRWIIVIEDFGGKAMQIWSSLTTYMNNKTQEQLNNEKRAYDEKSKALQEDLDNGIISQEEYNEQSEAIKEEYDEKEKALQLEQWKREKALNIGQAAMEGALAILKAWNSMSFPANLVPVGIATALAAAQLAAVASEPEPYAKGGYVERRTVYQAGEAGREWVASNRLLTDPNTADIIEGLEAYQRGRGLNALRMAQLNIGAAEEASSAIGRRAIAYAGTAEAVAPTVNVQPAVSDPQMLQVMRELATYLKDPKNRRAIISRQTIEDFDSREAFLRSKARL